MATVQHTIHLSPEHVYAALADPHTYPKWLVGCREIRRVDERWPAVGGRFHHRVGLVGPLTVADHSEVLDVEPDHKLSLEVRALPFGRGRATFTLRSGPDGPEPTTVVVLDEVPIGLLAPTTPLANPLIARRNRRSLANLTAFLERGETQDEPPA